MESSRFVSLSLLQVFRLLDHELRRKACICVIWNRGGVEPAGAAQLTTAARLEKPDAVVWRGDPELPLTEQGLTVLGAPVGQVEFVQAQLTKKGAEHEALLEMIPLVPNVQVAWLLILFCAGARANFLLRTVQPELTQDFARHHDEQLAHCLRRVLHINTMPPEVQVAASMLLTLGGLGIGNSERTRDAAHWGSWADCLEMIKIRHLDVARRIVQGMATRSSRCFQAVEEAASRLRLIGVDTPNWEVLSAGLRPEEGRRVKHRERDPKSPSSLLPSGERPNHGP